MTAQFGKRFARDITNSDQYRQQLAQHQQAADWAKFRTSYPEPIWQQMSPPQQAQAWATWQQNDQIRRASKIPGWLVGILVVAAVLVILVILF